MHESHNEGWLKTCLGALGGLFGGAALMYLSPLVDQVVRPAKPVANFAVEHQGMSVTFHNRSMGGGQGRWDFGDGSPLEFVPASRQTVTHTYPKPATYVATYTVTNLLGDESERSVTIELTPDRPETPPKPEIVDLYAKPPGKIGQLVYAPATFQFIATADNAQSHIWDFGDGAGIKLADYQTSHTFPTAGTYTVTVYAVNGKQMSQQDITLDVFEPPSDRMNIQLEVVAQGTQVDIQRREVVASQATQPGTEVAAKEVVQTFAASGGFEILDIERSKSLNTNLDKVCWEIAPDRKQVRVTAQVVSAETPGVLNEHATITERRLEPAQSQPAQVAGSLTEGETTVINLPPAPDNWTEVQRGYAMELRRGEKVLWKGAELPKNVKILIGEQAYSLVATAVDDAVQINLLRHSTIR